MIQVACSRSFVFSLRNKKEHRCFERVKLYKQGHSSLFYSSSLAFCLMSMILFVSPWSNHSGVCNHVHSVFHACPVIRWSTIGQDLSWKQTFSLIWVSYPKNSIKPWWHMLWFLILIFHVHLYFVFVFPPSYETMLSQQKLTWSCEVI